MPNLRQFVLNEGFEYVFRLNRYIFLAWPIKTLESIFAGCGTYSDEMVTLLQSIDKAGRRFSFAREVLKKATSIGSEERIEVDRREMVVALCQCIFHVKFEKLGFFYRFAAFFALFKDRHKSLVSFSKDVVLLLPELLHLLFGGNWCGPL